MVARKGEIKRYSAHPMITVVIRTGTALRMALRRLQDRDFSQKDQSSGSVRISLNMKSRQISHPADPNAARSPELRLEKRNALQKAAGIRSKGWEIYTAKAENSTGNASVDRRLTMDALLKTAERIIARKAPFADKEKTVPATRPKIQANARKSIESLHRNEGKWVNKNLSIQAILLQKSKSVTMKASKVCWGEEQA